MNLLPGAQYIPELQVPQPVQNVPIAVCGYSGVCPIDTDIEEAPVPTTVKPTRFTANEAVASNEWPPCCSDRVHI